jgi:hypothetical protein
VRRIKQCSIWMLCTVVVVPCGLCIAIDQCISPKIMDTKCPLFVSFSKGQGQRVSSANRFSISQRLDLSFPRLLLHFFAHIWMCEHPPNETEAYKMGFEHSRNSQLSWLAERAENVLFHSTLSSYQGGSCQPDKKAPIPKVPMDEPSPYLSTDRAYS